MMFRLRQSETSGSAEEFSAEDLCDVAAKSLGMSREQFFTQYPEQYRRYGDLVTDDY
jgi:hypothetical protein